MFTLSSSNRGGDLLKRINEQPMSEPDTVAIMQQLLEAVNYIHENSYMHLDVKVGLWGFHIGFS